MKRIHQQLLVATFAGTFLFCGTCLLFPSLSPAQTTHLGDAPGAREGLELNMSDRPALLSPLEPRLKGGFEEITPRSKLKPQPVQETLGDFSVAPATPPLVETLSDTSHGHQSYAPMGHSPMGHPPAQFQPILDHRQTWDAWSSENYSHLLVAAWEDAQPTENKNVAEHQSPCDRQTSHARAGYPLTLHKHAAYTYGNNYASYFVGGGVPSSPYARHPHGEPRLENEGIWATDYAPRYSKVASNWSHGRLYQGGLGQYEPDHKNRALGGQTVGRFFTNRDRRHTAEYYLFAKGSEGSESEGHFESLGDANVSDADSPVLQR